MSDDSQDNIKTDHEYDGIEEYDNQLPRWWVNLFWGTIIFSFIYIYIFHIGDVGNSISESYVQTYQEELIRLEQMEAEVPQKSEEELLALLDDSQTLNIGEEVYTAKCAACHAADGGGLVGPNLVDNYWIHGSSVLAIKDIVVNGVPEKGMVPWKALLSPEEIDAVSVYVKSMKGQPVANPKAPQGEIVSE